MINPYWGNTFVQFFITLFQRLLGNIPLNEIPPDEVQCLVLLGISFSSALVGSFLMLKKMAMLANSLSHTVLLGIVLTFILTLSFDFNFSLTTKTLLIASILSGLLTTLLTQFFTEVLKLQEDASIGIVFSSLFALGIVLVTVFTRNTHLGVELVMGNIDALHINDVKQIGYICILDALVISLFYNSFKILAFDELFGKSIGISATLFNYILMTLTAMTTLGSFRCAGVLLVLAFLIGPSLIARLWTHKLHTLIFLAFCIGSLCSVLGVGLSRHLLSSYQIPLSTGALVTTIIGLAYFISIFFKRVASFVAKKQQKVARVR